MTKTQKRNEQAALAYLAMKPKLDRAFDAWAAAKPQDADTMAQEYYARLDQMRAITKAAN